MRKLFISLLLAVVSATASAQYLVQNKILGPNNVENGSGLGIKVFGDFYHVPQFMPGFPTAATIWPRVVKTDCRFTDRNIYCDSIRLTQYGDRSEYLFFTEKEKSSTDTSIENLANRIDELSKTQKDLEKKIGDQKTVVILREVPVKDENQ